MQTSHKQNKLSVGRPRVLEREQILEAAIELGLENLTLKKLAMKLGAGTTTLYQYFDNREELLTAAAMHALKNVSLPNDDKLNWAEYSYEYINSLIQIMSENPTHISYYQTVGYGLEVHFSIVEKFLEGLIKRGFDAQTGIQLFRRLAMVAVATSVESVRHQKFEEENSTMHETFSGILAKQSVSAFPNLRQGLSIYTQTPKQRCDDLIYLIFKEIAESRHEDLSVLNFIHKANTL
ncbi:MAG: TetR/AcrR family transcriptional regulator [Parvibaculales bacterium]